MRGSFLKFSLTIILFLTILLPVNFSYGAIETTVDKIIADKESYDGHGVSVSGSVSNLKFKTSKGGKDYTIFILVGDSGGRINVFTWGRPKLKAAQKVRVTGHYRKVKKVGRQTFHNEIEAERISTP